MCHNYCSFYIFFLFSKKWLYFMTLDQLKPILKNGKYRNWGIIPGWIGFIKYNPYSDELFFTNKEYRLYENDLRDKLKNRNDLYYII